MIKKMFRLRAILAGASATALLIVGGLTGCPQPSGPATPPASETDSPPTAAPPSVQDASSLREALGDFNRGNAFMERYQYSDAAAAFAKALQSQTDWTAAKFNLALAQLNMLGQSEAKDNLDSARQGFEDILAKEPKHLHARFCLGMYYQHVGNMEKTLECFQAVYEGDPEDLYVCYKYAEALRNVGRQHDAIPILEKVVERDPGFVSAVYQLATMYTRVSKRDQALPLFKRFEKLNAIELTGGSYVVQASYGMAGKYYRVLGPDNLTLAAKAGPEQPRIVFSPDTKTWEAKTQRWKWRGGTLGLPG
ncbi:MAG: hypothetical protein MUF25_13750, partial [Pirellulaceae bacterium]|nr:hypothetical protein [Pirellulaceae bacterium]